MAVPDVRLDWHGDKYQHKAKSHGVIVLARIGILITTRAKQLLSTPGTGKVKGRQQGPVTHSAPGDPPQKQTGRLRASVTYEVDEAAGVMRAGTNVDYGRCLELGTKRGILPRPWLRRAVAEMTGQIQALLSSLVARF